MKTNKDYMEGKCSLAEYYSQFSPVVKNAVRRSWSAEYLAEKLAEDEHLNNIPLKLWDAIAVMHKGGIARKNKEINGVSSWSLCDGVCAAKQAAREIIREAGL